MKNFLKLLTVFFSILILFQGCVPSKPEKEEQIFPADRLIKKLEGNRRKVKTFHGNGVVSVESPKFGANANFEVTIKKPDSIKISIYGPFGIDVGHALVTKYDFKFYDVLKNKLYVGEKDRSILKSLFKIDLEFDDILDAFAGAVNLTDKLLSEPDLFQNSDEKFYLTYRDSTRGIQSYFVINESSLGIEEYSLSAFDGRKFLEGKYSNFRTFEDVPIPFLIRVENSSASQQLNVEYRKVEVNKDISKLTLTVPNDVEIIQW